MRGSPCMRADAADAETLTIRLLLQCLLARYLQMCNCGNVRVVLFLASSSELSINILCALLCSHLDVQPVLVN